LEKRFNPSLEQLKIFLWVVVVFEILILCLAIIVGNLVGYKLSFIAHSWLGLIVAVVFISIVIINILAIVLYRLYKRARRHYQS
jgi:ABC-type glycerol-3-phosphate transport system permease component